MASINRTNGSAPLSKPATESTPSTAPGQTPAPSTPSVRPEGGDLAGLKRRSSVGNDARPRVTTSMTTREDLARYAALPKECAITPDLVHAGGTLPIRAGTGFPYDTAKIKHPDSGDIVKIYGIKVGSDFIVTHPGTGENLAKMKTSGSGDNLVAMHEKDYGLKGGGGDHRSYYDYPSSSKKTVRAYRVEGAGNSRISIGGSGNVDIPYSGKSKSSGERALYVGFDEKRAANYLTQKRSEFSDSRVKSFKVESSYLDNLRKSSVAERSARSYSDRPMRVDEARGNDQYGLTTSRQINDLRSAIVPRSGRDSGTTYSSGSSLSYSRRDRRDDYDRRDYY